MKPSNPVHYLVHKSLLFLPTLRRVHEVGTLTPRFHFMLSDVHLKLDSKCEYAHSRADVTVCLVSVRVMRENIRPESNTMPPDLCWLTLWRRNYFLILAHSVYKM